MSTPEWHESTELSAEEVRRLEELDWTLPHAAPMDSFDVRLDRFRMVWAALSVLVGAFGMLVLGRVSPAFAFASLLIGAGGVVHLFRALGRDAAARAAGGRGIG